MWQEQKVKRGKKMERNKKESDLGKAERKGRNCFFSFFEIFCDREKAWDFGKWKKSPSF